LDRPEKPRAFTSGHTSDLNHTSGAAAPVKIVYRRVDELRPNPRNARRHQKRKIRDLAKEIKALGFIGAIITDETGMILAGHARYGAAKVLGLETVPTIVAKGLSETQKRVFALADNKFCDRSGWNRELLVDELKELSLVLPELNLDLTITGFELGEVDVPPRRNRG
jgi:ParB-like chromosome segregation protein Spo0J